MGLPVARGERNEPRLEETKRVARLIRLATLLTTQPNRWTRAALAGHFEIGERQIARDLDLIRGLGYAITHTRDGYAFENAPMLPALSLSMPEVLALALAAGLARDAGDVDTATLGAALARLEALISYAARGGHRRQLRRHTWLRSYRDSALSHEEALAELERGAGTQFDPLLVRHCIQTLRSQGTLPSHERLSA